LRSFIIESVALDVGNVDRLYLFGEDQECVFNLQECEVTLDGKDWGDQPMMRLVGTLVFGRYRVAFTPNPELDGRALAVELDQVDDAKEAA
jgi:hypothetical protein